MPDLAEVFKSLRNHGYTGQEAYELCMDVIDITLADVAQKLKVEWRPRD